MFIIPTTDYRLVGQSQKGGILLGIVPSSEPHFGVEIQRTSDDGTGTAASTGATSIAELDPVTVAGAPYFDALPADGNKRFYRARHIATGYTNGNWTDWTTGHYPVQSSEKEILLSVANLTGRGPGLSGTITKRITIPYSAFTARTSTMDYRMTAGYITPGTDVAPTTNTLQLRTSLLVPPGLTLVEINAMLFANSTAVVNQVALIRADSTDPAAVTTIATLAATGVGWETASTTVSQLASSSGYFEFQSSIINASAAAIGRIGWAEFVYTMPTHDQTY